MFNRVLLSAFLCCLILPMTPSAQTAPNEVRVHAAGSLRSALIDTASAFEAGQPGVKIKLTFGASGLLKDRIAGGEPTDAFASANMTHPEALSAAGRSGPVQRLRTPCACWCGPDST